MKREPLAHKEILEDVLVLSLFTRVGWLDYFLKLTEYDDDMAKEFAFTLQYNEAMVRGLIIDNSELAIAQVLGFTRTGSKYPVRANATTAREEFCERGENLDSTTQGTNISSIFLREMCFLYYQIYHL